MHRMVLVAAILMLSAAARADGSDDGVTARWIQFAPNAAEPARPEPVVLARALTHAAACPSFAIDGVPSGMTPRFAPDAPSEAFPMPVGLFPITACEAVVPPGHSTVRIGGVDLRLPLPHPKRILVIADTGCRMNGAAQQDCQDPIAFPLAFLAGYATLFRPDLIVHVGDYFYRDTACPDGVPTCPNTHTQWGDNWASWEGDFFGPIKPLLAAAPWIMTRGNHESCGRGAQGWYRLLDPKPYDPAAAACARGSEWDFSPTYVVPVGNVNVLVHDSSFAEDQKVNVETARRYEADLRHVLGVLGEQAPPSVFMTHKPTYGMVKGSPDSAGNFTLQYLFNGLFGGIVPKPISLFLSGHIHSLQAVNFVDPRFAPQLIVGVGGSLLDPPMLGEQKRYDLAPGTMFDIVTGPDAAGSARIAAAHAQSEFGFAVLDATQGGFVADMFTIGGQQAGRCTISLVPRNLDCRF